jgi:hypothetical protein
VGVLAVLAISPPSSSQLAGRLAGDATGLLLNAPLGYW